MVAANNAHDSTVMCLRVIWSSTIRGVAGQMAGRVRREDGQPCEQACAVSALGSGPPSTSHRPDGLLSAYSSPPIATAIGWVRKFTNRCFGVIQYQAASPALSQPATRRLVSPMKAMSPCIRTPAHGLLLNALRHIVVSSLHSFRTPPFRAAAALKQLLPLSVGKLSARGRSSAMVVKGGAHAPNSAA